MKSFVKPKLSYLPLPAVITNLLKMADSIPTVPLTVIQTSISLIIDIVLILVSAEMIFNSGYFTKSFL